MKSRSDCKGQAGQRTPSGSASGHGQAGGTVAARRADAIIFCPPTTHHGVHRVGARAAGEAQISSQGRAVQAEGVARNGAGSERHDVDALVGTGQRKDSRRSGWCRGGGAGSGAAEGGSGAGEGSRQRKGGRRSVNPTHLQDVAQAVRIPLPCPRVREEPVGPPHGLGGLHWQCIQTEGKHTREAKNRLNIGSMYPRRCTLAGAQ